MPALNENANKTATGRTPLKHFARHLFLASRVYSEKNRAKENVAVHLKKMRKSIIKMRLSYTDIDRLKEKIDKLVGWEREYAKFFKIEDDETQELKRQLNALEEELSIERQENQKAVEEKDGRIMQMEESLANIRSQSKSLLMEKAKRQHRLRALEQKIHERVDVQGYYS